MAKLWGGETDKAVDNFPISGETIPLPVIHWLGRIKAGAARANAQLGLLDKGVATAVAEAGMGVARGEFDDQFPVDVFQTGSGTSSNMNTNEVIAKVASREIKGVKVHANDEISHKLIPALEALEKSFAAKAKEFSGLVKAGRTHLMDAVPVTLGQEFAGYAAQVRLGTQRVKATLPRLGMIPLGGTATGTGLNTHPKFAKMVREIMAKETNLKISAPADPFEAQANRDGLVEASAALKMVAVSLTKIANDLAWMGSGPRCGLGEIFLPELQKGSSIMPGKVNPVIPEVVMQVGAQVIGNDTAITVAGTQGNFELNVRIPLMARNLLQSVALLTSTATVFRTKCVDGIEPNLEGLLGHAEGTLAAATALNPYIGYDLATDIVKDATASGRSLREVAREKGVDEATLNKALNLKKIAKGGII